MKKGWAYNLRNEIIKDAEFLINDLTNFVNNNK